MKHDAEKTLTEILTSGMDVHRCAAARALGATASDAARDTLIKALLDEDPDVRVDAATSLVRLADPASADQLMENLIGDPESEVKKQAIRALVAMRHDAALPILRQLVVGRTDEIYWDEDEFYQDGWDSWVDVQMLVIESLGKLGDTEAVALILQALGDEEGQDVGPVAIPALAALGAEGAAALADLLKGARELMRLRIAKAVAGAGNPDAEALETLLLGDEAPNVRITALRGLASDDPRLEELFDDASSQVRAAVIAHAGADFPEKTAALMQDPVADVAVAAFGTVADNPALFDSDETRKTVRDSIADDPKIASAAALAWVALRGPKGVKGFRKVLANSALPLEYRLGVVKAMRKAGPVSAQYLVDAVSDDERQLRLDAMTALAELAGEDKAWPNPAAEALLAALRGELVPAPEEPPEDVEATFEQEALAPESPEKIADEEAGIDESLPFAVEGGSTLDAILNPAPIPEISEEPDEIDPEMEHLHEIAGRMKFGKNKVSLEVKVAPWQDVRRYAATLLGNVPNEEVAEALLAALDDEDAEVVTGALNSLAALGERLGALPEDVMGPMADMLATGFDDARPLAVRVLAHVPGAEADEWLETLLEDEADFVRLEAVRAMNLRGHIPETLTAALSDRYTGVAQAAARALARHKGAESVNDLIGFACMHDGTYRSDVARWLAETAPLEAMQGFVDLLQDESQKRNWLVGIDALAELIATIPEDETLAAA